ncbi:MAG TPA: hypothetical protein VLR90_04975, partial [Blastocatellia bacterium]|nr:hypothetical protein [Blastocatellia bacterium]
FDLESAREWMRDNQWDHFEFEADKQHDIGFSRYLFPGKAHVDYWQDEELFNHFIETVVEKNSPPPSNPAEKEKWKAKKEKAAYFAKKPSKWLPKIISNTVPYLLIFAILFVAVFLIYKAALAFNGWKPSSSTVAGSVLGLAFLLGGVTVVSRVPRLTNLLKWRLIAFGIFALCAVIYVLLNIWLIKDPSESPGYFIPQMFTSQLDSYPWLGVLMLALVVVGLVYGLNILRPKSKYQMWPLLVIGFLAVILLVAQHIFSIRLDENKKTSSQLLSLPVTKVDAQTKPTESTDATAVQEVKEDKDNPTWPLFLALAGFLYLWWLAALIFDLVFAWQRYIRYAGIMKHLDAIKYGKKAKADRKKRESQRESGGNVIKAT